MPLASEEHRVPLLRLEDGPEDGLLPVRDNLKDPASRLAALAMASRMASRGSVRWSSSVKKALSASLAATRPMSSRLLGSLSPAAPTTKRSLPWVVRLRVKRAASRLFPVWAKSMTTRKGLSHTTSIRPGTPGKVARRENTLSRGRPKARAAVEAARAFSRL